MHLRQFKIGLALAALAAPSAPPCASCQSAPAQPAPRALAASSSEAVAVIREINDPSTGDRWLLVRDRSRPGGPGRLLLLAGPPRAWDSSATHGISPARAEPDMPAPATPIVHAPIFQAPLLQAPLIHAGDPLVVEEDTPVVEARLAATALGPAARGATLEARLSIGGKVVRVRALAAGRAALEPGLPPEPGAAP
jgi:hypothetical protein